LLIAVAPKATAKGIRASKTGTIAFAPEKNAAAEDADFDSSSMAPLRLWATPLDRISSLSRGL
jgi:hypothetical protein